MATPTCLPRARRLSGCGRGPTPTGSALADPCKVRSAGTTAANNSERETLSNALTQGLDIDGFVGVWESVSIRCCLDLRLVKFVRRRNIVVADDILDVDVDGDLFDVLDGLEEQPPSIKIMPAPALPFGEIAAEHVCELHHRLGRHLGRELQAGELRHHDVCRRPRVLIAKFQTHGPTA